MDPCERALMLTDFFVWWIHQIHSLLRELRGAARAPDAVIVNIDRFDNAGDPSGALLLRQSGQTQHLRRLDEPSHVPVPSNLPVLLQLPVSSLLSRELVLPLAASRDLQALLRFEMDRLTPFDADELLWGVSGQHSNRSLEQLRVRLEIVPRPLVTALLDWLSVQNLVPGWIEYAGGRILLSQTETRQRRQFAFKALCAVLAFACLTVPLIRQQIALNKVSALVDARTPQAKIAEALRAHLAADASGRAAIKAARSEGDALQVLAALTDALPDDTWLADLTLKSGSLTIDGQSANAAKLIGLLSAVPGLQNPSFTAPVTRTNDGKADMFSLHAQVAG